jgi:hypothetical protein
MTFPDRQLSLRHITGRSPEATLGSALVLENASDRLTFSCDKSRPGSLLVFELEVN